MNRAAMNYEEREAMHLLDLVRAGVPVPMLEINRALIVTGDAVGLKSFNEVGERIRLTEPRALGDRWKKCRA